MNAMILNAKGGPETLTLADIPKPALKAGEVLVQVHATAITPSELLWKPTFFSRDGQARSFPIVLGHEFSGVIADTRGEVGDFEVGDAVYGMNDWFSNGAQAEFCVASSSSIAPKPRSLTHAQAATVPISALTAWQALIVRSRLRHGQNILIHGAAGAVGVWAVQIAHECGAHIVATASAADRDFLHKLGANEVLDYRTTAFETVVRDVDVVFDTVGGQTLHRSWGILSPEGKVVTIAAQSEGPNDRRTRDAFMLVEADHAQLVALSEVIDGGRRQVFVAAEFPLPQAREAYASAAKGGRGKTVLRVAPPTRE
jgi:NADPH:quinone reductase-like Zn-dependent oxidoreductase